MEQHQQLEDIGNILEDTQINMDKGNKYLDKTIESNMSSRRIMFTFLILMSFSLLFLNWYS